MLGIVPNNGPIEVNIFFFFTVVYFLLELDLNVYLNVCILELDLTVYFSERVIIFRFCVLAFKGLPLKLKVCPRKHLERTPHLKLGYPR